MWNTDDNQNLSKFINLHVGHLVHTHVGHLVHLHPCWPMIKLVKSRNLFRKCYQLTYLLTDELTWVDARDACGSKNYKCDTYSGWKDWLGKVQKFSSLSIPLHVLTDSKTLVSCTFYWIDCRPSFHVLTCEPLPICSQGYVITCLHVFALEPNKHTFFST